MQTTFLMVKPDALQRRLVGEVITRVEKKGLVKNVTISFEKK